MISHVLRKEGTQTEREGEKKERMKRWGSAQVDVGGWAMWEQVQITPTHAPLVQQPPQAPTSSCSSCSRMACRKARRSYPEDFWSNMPAWMTFWSTFSLYLAAARIFSSTLLTVQRRRTRTSFCWPIRWALSWACRSCWSTHIKLVKKWQRPGGRWYFYAIIIVTLTDKQ